MLRKGTARPNQVDGRLSSASGVGKETEMSMNPDRTEQGFLKTKYCFSWNGLLWLEKALGVELFARTTIWGPS